MRPCDSVADGPRLLIDLLEHEVLEPAFFGHDRVPSDPLLLRLDDVTVKIRNADRILGQHCDLPVAEKEHVARVLKYRRNVRCDKEFPVAQADHDRRALANGYDRVWFVNRDDRKGKDAPQFLDRFSDRRFQGKVFLLLVVSDQMSNHFGIGLGLKVASRSMRAVLSTADSFR